MSYIFHPATGDTNLEPIRLFRGTAARSSELDGISTVIVDLEKDLGRSAYESGSIYEPIIAKKLTRPKIEGGHSLGSTLVQYRLANMDHIQSAYLYCGPGVPEIELEKFNQKTQPVELVIRLCNKDKWNKLGQAHLGYKAPPQVQVNFVVYRTPQKLLGNCPHVSVWGRERAMIGMEGGLTSEERDAQFFHKHTLRERLRSTAGPIAAGLLRSLRNFCRNHFSTRVEQEKGLKIGHMLNGRWQVAYYRPVTANLEPG